MPIDRISSAQFNDKLRSALLSRTTSYDTAFGPIPDVVLTPVATVLEDQNNNRLRRVSLLLSLMNSTEFTEADLDATVFNEDILRPLGSFASVLLTFTRRRPFASTESGLIPRGFPIGTSTDEATGQAVTFVTTETKDKTFAVAVLDTTTNQTVYQLQISAICLVIGSAGKVGPDRVNRPLRPLVGWDSVTNSEGAQEGRDLYTNDELIELYLLAVSSRQLSVPTGSEFHIRDTFPSVQDVHEVFGTDPLLTRAATDAGAVDAFVVGDDIQTRTDQVTFLGIGQRLVVTTPPVVRVDTISRVGDGHIFVEGTDYVVSLDTTGVSGSVRAKDGIVFLPTASPQPTVGDLMNITYAYNQLIRDIQADTNDPEVMVNGRDELIRLGTRVDIFLVAGLTTLSGFVFSDIQLAAQTAITSYINTLGLGKPVDFFQIDSVVGKISGVDNFVITRLTRNALGSGAADVAIAGNEYAQIDVVNLTISPL